MGHGPVISALTGASQHKKQEERRKERQEKEAEKARHDAERFRKRVRKALGGALVGGARLFIQAAVAEAARLAFLPAAPSSACLPSSLPCIHRATASPFTQEEKYRAQLRADDEGRKQQQQHHHHRSRSGSGSAGEGNGGALGEDTAAPDAQQQLSSEQQPGVQQAPAAAPQVP